MSPAITSLRETHLSNTNFTINRTSTHQNSTLALLTTSTDGTGPGAGPDAYPAHAYPTYTQPTYTQPREHRGFHMRWGSVERLLLHSRVRTMRRKQLFEPWEWVDRIGLLPEQDRRLGPSLLGHKGSTVLHGRWVFATCFRTKNPSNESMPHVSDVLKCTHPEDVHQTARPAGGAILQVREEYQPLRDLLREVTRSVHHRKTEREKG